MTEEKNTASKKVSVIMDQTRVNKITAGSTRMADASYHSRD